VTQEKPVLMRRGDPKYTWDDTVKAIGKDFSGGKARPAQETVAPSAVARYCEVWEIGNPIYWDVKAAKQAGYGNVVVPWSSTQQTFTNDTFWRPGEPTRFPMSHGKDASAANPAPPEESEGLLPMPVHTNSVRTDMEIEFFEPVCVGDKLTSKGDKVVNVRPRTTRIGVGAFINWEFLVYNQRGALVARVVRGSYAYNPT